MSDNAIYFGRFENRGDVEIEYDTKLDKGVEIIVAAYEEGGYDGWSFVLYKDKDGLLFEVNAIHCSCYGLESQFEPEETSIDALMKREFYSFNAEIHKALIKYKNEEQS